MSFCNRTEKRRLRVDAKMGDESPYEPHIVPMMALGRHFKIGDLYDYCSDRILTGMLNIL